MLSNYYTLALLASDLDVRLHAKTIAGAFTQEKNELVITFHGMPGALVISCLTGTNTLFLHPDFARSRKNSTDILRGLAGKTVMSVSISPADRVISFSLDHGLNLHACFFGSKANVLLVDGESRVADAFKDARSIAGETYSPPQGKILYDVTVLHALVAQNPNEKLLALLKRDLPVLGSTLAKEILFRAKLSGTSEAREAAGQHFEPLARSLSAVLVELSSPSPRVYVSRDPYETPSCFSLLRLESCHDYRERQFRDVHEAIRFFISRTRATHDLQSQSRNVLQALRERKKKLQRIVTAVEGDLKTSSRAEEYERSGHLLMANLGSMTGRAKSIALEENGDQIVTIPLDPRLSPALNAQRYFEKAKKSRIAYDESRKRLAETLESLRTAEDLIAEACTIKTPEDLKGFLAEHKEALIRVGIGEKAKKQEQFPFRIFTVDGGYEVWAGKSSRNNDELTLKYAKPNDLWFHARGASGSHVVLKSGKGKGEPSKRAREQAAGIAAYYSKMRNAKVVPVAMTERKYVRKPKGVSPGTVVLDREKVIFAEPGLPQ